MLARSTCRRPRPCRFSTAFEPRWTSAVPPTITRPMRSIAHHEHKCASRRLPMRRFLRPGSYDAVLFADVDLDSYPLSHEEGPLATLTSRAAPRRRVFGARRPAARALWPCDAGGERSGRARPCDARSPGTRVLPGSRMDRAAGTCRGRWRCQAHARGRGRYHTPTSIPRQAKASSASA